MKKHYNGRVEGARKMLDEKKLDALLLFSGASSNDLSSENTYYLGGFFDVWPHAVLVTKKDAVLFTAETDRAEKECCIDVADLRTEKIHGFLNKRNLRRIGVDAGFSFQQWNKIKPKLKKPVFSDVSESLLELRSIKDKKEISLMRSAADATKSALLCVEKSLASFDEATLAKKVKTDFAAKGADAAFAPIISGDANSANLHYFACNKKYKRILMADIGARKGFYNSDFTRTHVISGTPEMARAYDVVSRLIDALRDFVSPENTCLEVHKYAKEFLAREGYKKECFSNFHALGHGVGLNTHEHPLITERMPYSKTLLRENMAFTLEPALYFKDKFGVRMESTFLLTKKGLREL